VPYRAATLQYFSVNALVRIARLLVVLALGVGAPQAYVGAVEPAALAPAQCVDQQLLCAKLRQSDARVAIVSARESTQFSLKSAKRSSPRQAAVLLGVVSRSTAQESVFLAAGGRRMVTVAGLSTTPVRAPPASA
jgi:hypothetical protein